ncbi:MAG: hypothetical protein QM758_07240 [Armatimonas sp.]
MSRLKRFAIGTGITLAALGAVIPLWYQSHYGMLPEQARRIALPSPNGFDTLQDALKLEVETQSGIVVRPWYANSPSTRQYPTQALAGRVPLLAANRPAIEKTREALQQEYLFPIDTPSALNYPKYARLRNLARLLTFASQTYADSGNQPEAMRCAIDGMELGITVPRGADLSPALTGLACESLNQRAAWALVDSLDAKTARAAALRLAKIEGKRWSLVETIDEERQSNNRMYLPMFFKDGPRSSWRLTGELKDYYDADSDTAEEEQVAKEPTLSDRAHFLWWRIRVVYYGPKTVLDNSDQWMKAVREQAQRPWGSKRVKVLPPQDPLNEFIFPFFPAAEFRDVHVRAQSALLQTYLALHAYHLEHGIYPKALSQLVAQGYLEAVPIDPFSPTRAPLSYSPDGKLWSVGPDAQNDGGKPIDMEGKRGYITANKTGDFVARVNTW